MLLSRNVTLADLYVYIYIYIYIYISMHNKLKYHSKICVMMLIKIYFNSTYLFVMHLFPEKINYLKAISLNTHYRIFLYILWNRWQWFSIFPNSLLLQLQLQCVLLPTTAVTVADNVITKPLLPNLVDWYFQWQKWAAKLKFLLSSLFPNLTSLNLSDV